MTPPIPTQLNRAALAGLAPAHRPLVDPRDLRPRIVHFGLGAFHRAHQAVYTEAAAARTGEPWGIAAVAPRSADTVAAMRAQDCLYSVTDLAPDAGAVRVVGAVVEALRMRADAARLTQLLASPEVTVVTLTVTEKGYSRRPDTGGLDTSAPGVAADLAATADTDADLVTVIGRLTASLAARFRAGGGPIDVVSCDNTATNGAALGRRGAGVRRGVGVARPGCGPRLAGDLGRVPRHDRRPHRPGHHRPRTATPPRRRSASATRWPSSASPTGSGCCRTRSSRTARGGSSTAPWSSRTWPPTS